ncbi:NERD domain-containing protein [Sporolactobacillus sp. CPB3-1]|uniref:NERD domain-containing protein n=1 Tax=Sporolactobacillus mangiferae TaxID=2940498 RepID=A0ABT0MCY0_9BACL|nr:NERD domain-containing protein [Sporolactobacillus mangiferae]MCL1632170.1 NERD domain-containing protein [Sporolactobacillus mangiferae]
MILTGSRGIFTLEIKNYGEKGVWGLRISRDGRWIRVNPDKTEVTFDKNATEQSNRHFVLLERKINLELGKYGYRGKPISVFPIIVIANDIIDIHNESDVPIIRRSNLIHEVRKYNEKLLENVLQFIREMLGRETLPPKKHPKHFYRENIVDYLGQLRYDIETLCEIGNRYALYALSTSKHSYKNQKQ